MGTALNTFNSVPCVAFVYHSKFARSCQISRFLVSGVLQLCLVTLSHKLPSEFRNMNAKQENKETSTSPKEQEKLKQRLKTLFKQQEQKTKQKKVPKSSQKKNQYSKESQQVNGEPAKKLNKQSSNVQQNINERKSVKNKHINGLSGGLSKKNVNEKQSPVQHELHDMLGGELKNNRKQNKNKKVKSMQPAAALQPELAKKNKKSKFNTPATFKSEAQLPSKIPNSNVPLASDGQKKLSKNQNKKAKKRAAVAAPVSNQINPSKKRKLDQQESKKKSKKAKKQNFGLQNKQLPPHLAKHGVANNQFNASNMPGLVKGGDFDQDASEDEDYWNPDRLCDSDIMDDIKSVDDQNPEEGFYRFSNIQEFHGNGGISFDHSEDYESGDDPYNYSDLSEEEEEFINASYNNTNFEENELDKENPFDENELGDDPYNYSDYKEDEEEEELENYSDLDEDDYEVDEDSYGSTSDSDFSSNFDASCDDTGKMGYSDEGGEDEDYKLPDHVPEDLIIHSGTATKRDLLPEDNVDFKDKKYMQIVELKDHAAVKVIRQPTEYQKEELLKLTYKENQSIKVVVATKNEKVMASSASDVKDDCPKLVPIVDDDGFQLYNPYEEDDDSAENEYECSQDEEEQSYEEEDDTMETYSLGSEYTEINSDDADSLLSEDINDKYLNRRWNDDDDFYSSDEGNALLAAQQKVDVIDATNCAYNAGEIGQDHEESGDSDQAPLRTLPKLGKVERKVRIISTPVIDDNMLKDKRDNCSEGKRENKTKKTGNSLDVSNLSEDSRDDTNKSEHVVSTSSNLEDSEGNKSKDTKQSAVRLKTTAQSLVGYKTIFCNAVNANLVLVLLKDPFYIYGTARLTLLAGTVEVYGHFLARGKEMELFSPRGCSEIEISAIQTPAKEFNSKDKIENTLKYYESNFTKPDLEKIASGYEPGKDAVVLLKRNEERKKIVQQFKKFMNENVFPNLQNITMDRPLYDSEYLLRCMINISVTEHKCLRLPQQWQAFEVTENSRVMLVGGKGVGKSTLIRYLINRHITLYKKVLLIDLDIGQPEIFVPQTVSCSVVEKPLLGPGFLLNIQPEKSYVVGNTNIALCPHKYVEAVRSILRYCLAQEKFKNIPWFVNTMGYNKGFGPELISVIASELPLTDVIQLQSNKAINNFDSLLFPQVVIQIPRNMFVEDFENPKENSQELSYRLHVWQSAVMQESRYQKEWDMSPKDMRYAILLTRLSEALQGHAEWLSDCKPMSASLDQLKLVNLMDDIPPRSPEELAKAMEANLVHLCHYKEDQHSVECLGIGVVRAVDYHVQQLYLLPAMSSPSLLKRVNCLALGEMPLPSSVFTNQGSRVQKTAPFVYNTIEAKASKAIKQIYRRPTKFLKGKHT